LEQPATAPRDVPECRFNPKSKQSLFHNPGDRGADVVDRQVIERFAGAFAMVATSLAGT